MIPKLMHFMWKGGPLPERYRAWVAEWTRLHPDWQINEWGDVPVAPAPPGECCHARQWSNWNRLQILRQVGGVYIDYDTQPLKNIEPLLEGCSAAATPFSLSFVPKDSRVCNSFLAAEPGHPWIEECCELLHTVDPAVPLSMGSSLVTKALINHPEVRLLDKNAILQRPRWSDLGRRPPEGCYAIHHFDNMAKRKK